MEYWYAGYQCTRKVETRTYEYASPGKQQRRRDQELRTPARHFNWEPQRSDREEKLWSFHCCPAVPEVLAIEIAKQPKDGADL
jgi:hypothetical protein